MGVYHHEIVAVYLQNDYTEGKDNIFELIPNDHVFKAYGR